MRKSLANRRRTLGLIAGSALTVLTTRPDAHAAHTDVAAIIGELTGSQEVQAIAVLSNGTYRSVRAQVVVAVSACIDGT